MIAVDALAGFDELLDLPPPATFELAGDVRAGVRSADVAGDVPSAEHVELDVDDEPPPPVFRLVEAMLVEHEVDQRLAAARAALRGACASCGVAGEHLEAVGAARICRDCFDLGFAPLDDVDGIDLELHVSELLDVVGRGGRR